MADSLQYDSVNNSINDIFFDGRFAAQPVYLSMDNALRKEVAGKLGIDPTFVEDSICECVSSALVTYGDPFSRHAAAGRQWRRNGMRSPPPFTALLFMLSHAAEQMEEGAGVASNNYYVRLSEVCGVDVPVLKHYRHTTEPLWIALNDWLVANSHILGRPTAYTNGTTWRYVEWPMSQAIVRASDRDRFHDLFERYGFTGSETISRRDMIHYLAGWMTTSAPNSRLRNAWSKPSLRERVAEAAIAELVTWSGSASSNARDGTQATRVTRLSLIANLVPRFPSQVLELHVGYLGEQADPITLANANGEFQFGNHTFGSFATITPSPLMQGNTALGESLAFTQHGANASMEWQPRLVIPLARPPQGSLWVEATRVSFGTPHMLLVRDTNDLPQKVLAHLVRAAAKPPTKATAATLKGLPEGWVLYHDVQVADASIHPDTRDLECLVPLGNDSVLEVTGGLELLPRFFHIRRPPSARLVVPSGKARVGLSSIGREAELASSSEDGKEASLLLDAQSTGHADLLVRGFQDGTLVDKTEVYLREAGSPTPLQRDGRGQLRHSSILSASQWDGGSGGVSGMYTAADAAFDLPDMATAADAAGELPSGGEETLQEATYTQAITQQVGRHACIQAGYHYWKVPTVPEGTPRGTPFNCECLNCKQQLVLVYRPRRGRAAAPTTNMALGNIALDPIPAPTNNDQQPVDHDLLLDALCFLGHGSWSKFETLFAGVTQVQQYPRQLAQNYASLGLLDLELCKGSDSIRSWCVPEASANFTTDGRAFLAGFRCANLVEEISERIVAAGGRISVDQAIGVPSAIFIEGLDAMQLRKALDGTVDPHGRQVVVNEKPAYALAAACLLLDPIESSLSPVSVGRASNLQVFTLHNAKWEDVEAVRGSGCYRWNKGAQVYAFVDRQINARSGPYQAVKLLAARDTGIKLHAYDRASQSFNATLGCEPPGLLARALVACSGTLPAMGRGTITYKGVPPVVAATILGILYDDGAPR